MRVALWLLEFQLTLTRWMIYYKFTSPARVIPLILNIRQTRERIIYAHTR